MKKSFVKSGLLALLALAPAHADTLGKIGELEVKTGEIREALAGLGASGERPLATDTAALAQYVRALLIQRLVLQKALDQKWDQKPEVIAKLVRARESALTESYLESVSEVPAGFPSEAELQTSYDAIKPSLLVPQTHRLAQIFVASPKDADSSTREKAKAKLDDIREKLKTRPADFATIASTHSDETASKTNGGEIGWLAESQLQPGIREVLPQLGIGAISEPVKLDDGWHLIKLLETKEARTPELSEVRDQLIVQIRAERARLNRQEFLAGLLEDHPLAINEIELSKLVEAARKP